ncbi:MAG: hypothetical protein ACREPA_10265 [Candidatus Dormibacteraceae bacterium]
MRPYTFVQLVEVAIFAGVLLYGLLTPHAWVAMVGGGLLIGKAILNILSPEGGSLYRRSLLGYALGAIFAVVGIALIGRTGP